MISIRIMPDGRVTCRAVLRSSLSVGKVWGQLRDFRTFARQEFFHAGIHIEGGLPRAGAALRLEHRFFLFRLHRQGRICLWREGEGFAFSDLSPRGVRRGFPHVFAYRLRPIDTGGCQIEIRVGGIWTARFLPRWIAWLWLRWVMQYAAQNVENRLLAYQYWLARRSAEHLKSDCSNNLRSPIPPRLPNSEDCVHLVKGEAR